MSTAQIAIGERVPPSLRVAQLLLAGPLGALVIAGSLIFTVIAPTKDLNAIDWLVAACALVLGAANLYVGLRLARRPELRAVALALISAHTAYGLMKVIGYDEPEAGVFIALDLAALLVLWKAPAGR